MTKTKEIGKQQEVRVLYWIARFGYLSALQVARLVYRSQAGAKTLVHRKLTSLTRLKWLKRQFVEGSYYYYLTSAGAHVLRDLHGLNVKGFEPNFGYFTHRQCANNYVIHHLLASDFRKSAITEFEIQTGRSPVVTIHGKVADAILIEEGMAEWIEVENAYKNVEERNKCAEFCAVMLSNPEHCEPLTDDILLEEISFVACNREALKRMTKTLGEYVEIGRISAEATQSIRMVLFTEDQAIRGECPKEVRLPGALEAI